MIETSFTFILSPPNKITLLFSRFTCCVSQLLVMYQVFLASLFLRIKIICTPINARGKANTII